MLQISNREELREGLDQLRMKSSQIIFVPTMGCLHQGHRALVDRAREYPGAAVVVSIWVNPLQFNNPHDLSTYPKNLSRDLELLKKWDVDAVFTPHESWFAKNLSTFIDCPDLGHQLCGVHRPGHFRGVCTVVMRLFMLIRPDKAIFGDKDLQQLTIIRAMCRDYFLEVKILSVATVRNDQGLALSSRLARLSPGDIEKAQMIYLALQHCQKLYQQSNGSQLNSSTETPENLTGAFRRQLATCPGLEVEYAEVRNLDDLAPWHQPLIAKPPPSTTLRGDGSPKKYGSQREQKAGAVLMVAVKVGEGGVRLIDHIAL